MSPKKKAGAPTSVAMRAIGSKLDCILHELTKITELQNQMHTEIVALKIRSASQASNSIFASTADPLPTRPQRLITKDTPIDDRPLTFGKCRGLTPREVAEDDPKYLTWIYENINDRRLMSDELYKSVSKFGSLRRWDEDSPREHPAPYVGDIVDDDIPF